MSPRLALIVPMALLVAGCDDAPAKPAAPKAKTREILGKRTQDIKETPAEIQKGAVVAPPRPISRDPITVAGSAYISAIGQTSIGLIKHATDLYQATNGEYPKTHQEFMDKIIKENNIALPTLPYYQEYSYDVAGHQLKILEYPDRKAAGPR